VSEFDREAPIMRRFWPTRGGAVSPCGKNEQKLTHHSIIQLKFLLASLLFFWYYSPLWTLASSKIVLHCSRSCYFTYPVPQVHVPQIVFNRPIPLQLGFPTRRVPSGLRTVSFQQGSSSCMLKSCPSHLDAPIFSTLTMPNRTAYKTHYSIHHYLYGRQSLPRGNV
jgi:hypothetical protein